MDHIAKIESNLTVNSAIIGSTMRDCVERAIRLIREKRFTFDLTQKGVRPDGRKDWVTDADTEAQMMYAKVLRERFPLFGIIAEEADLRVVCTHPAGNYWFSVDPLDGTSAFKRKQSHGIGTMIACMHDNEVIAVAIGDVMSGEIYYYRPDSEKTHRLDVHQHNYSQVLSINTQISLREQNILLRDPVEKHSSTVRFLSRLHPNPLFDSHEITGGSIGLSMARLWKGEVGAAVLRPGIQKPWDWCPVLGITKRLGFRFFFVNHHFDPGLVLWNPSVGQSIKTDYDCLIIHESRFQELHTWCQKYSIGIKL